MGARTRIRIEPHAQPLHRDGGIRTELCSYSLSEHILDYEKAGNNVYTRSQARRLDKYLYRKSRQAAGRIGIADTKKAASDRTTYEQKVKEKNNM